MAFYFAGGEDSEFIKNGNASMLSVVTGTTFKRSQARCSLQNYLTAGGIQNTTWWSAALASAITNLWLTCRFGSNATSVAGYFIFGLSKAGIRRIGVVGSGVSGKMSIGKVTVGNVFTILATESGTFAANTLYKLDLQIINFGATGTINLYRDGTLICTFTGDLTTDSITNLDGIILGTNDVLVTANFSEIICTDADTRSLGLITMDPAANGNTYNWTNSFASVNETVLDDATLIVGAANNDTAQFTAVTSRVGTVNTIAGVVISGRFQKGSGVQQLNFGVRTGGVDYWSLDQVLQTTLINGQYVFEQNPATASDWTQAQITAAGFNFGVRAKT